MTSSFNPLLAEGIDTKDVVPSESNVSSPEQSPSSPPITITTTVGSGPNKRKEVMTLPLPPGALPPRKRAKTKDEKEQRRIERIMRNRQAAHASREKKRRHVEDLENKCVFLESENEQLRGAYDELKQRSESKAVLLSENINKLLSIFTKEKVQNFDAAAFMKKLDQSLESISKAPFKFEQAISSKPIERQDSQLDQLTSSPSSDATISSVTTSSPTRSNSNSSSKAHSSSTSTASGSNYTTSSSIFSTPRHNSFDEGHLSDSGSLPSLTSSGANSPNSSSLDIMIKSEDEDDSVAISLAGDDEMGANFPLFGGLMDYPSHHPAEVMRIRK